MTIKSVRRTNPLLDRRSFLTIGAGTAASSIEDVNFSITRKRLILTQPAWHGIL
jgi:hypothetical protein